MERGRSTGRQPHSAAGRNLVLRVALGPAQSRRKTIEGIVLWCLWCGRWEADLAYGVLLISFSAAQRCSVHWHRISVGDMAERRDSSRLSAVVVDRDFSSSLLSFISLPSSAGKGVYCKAQTTRSTYLWEWFGWIGAGREMELSTGLLG